MSLLSCKNQKFRAAVVAFFVRRRRVRRRRLVVVSTTSVCRRSCFFIGLNIDGRWSSLNID